MAVEYLHDDLEVGLALAPLQRLQLAGNGLRIEAPWCVELGLQPAAGGIRAQGRSAVRDVAPDDPGLAMPGQRAIATMQQIVQRIQARSKLPVLAGHEYAVDLRIQAGDIVYGGAFDVQHKGHVWSVARLERFCPLQITSGDYAAA